VEKQFFIQQC